MKRLAKIGIFVIILILCTHIIKTGTERVLHLVFPLEYKEAIKAYAHENALDEYVVMGVIYAESQFSAGAHSGVAKGLMQITDQTAKEIAEKLGMEYNEDMAYNPEKSIRMGCYYLAHLYEIFENWDTALAAYNAGPGKVKEWLLDDKYSKDGENLLKIPYPETESYVRRVQRLTELYRNLY